MKKLIKILPVVMAVCMVLTSVFAVSVPKPGDLQAPEGQGTATVVTNTARGVWSTVITIVQILAVAAVVFAGLRYMFASADQKADIKKSMGVLAIGAVLVFGATLVLQLVSSATTQVLPGQ